MVRRSIDLTPRALRILLADDDATNRMVALAMLRRFGIEADAVEDGAEAVEAVRRTDYDLVLMDMQMPGMDGLEATSLIRQERAAPLPIIAMTANAIAEHRDACLEAGMDDFVTKPVTPRALKTAIARWTDGGAHGADGAAAGSPQ